VLIHYRSMCFYALVRLSILRGITDALNEAIRCNYEEKLSPVGYPKQDSEQKTKTNESPVGHTHT